MRKRTVQVVEGPGHVAGHVAGPEVGHVAGRAGATIPRVTGLALLLGVLSGCQGITGASPVSQVRVIDASPDAPGMDIYQGGTALAYNLGFGTVTSYVSIPPGSSAMAADTAGTKQHLNSARGTFAAATQYTVLVGNVAANLSETILADQSWPAPAGEIAVRFLHQATHLGAGVNVYLVPKGQTLSTVSPLLTNLVFGENGGYINVPAGTYTVVLLPAGMVPTAATIPIYTGAQVTYASGAARTLVLLDDQGVSEPGFQVITADDFDSPQVTKLGEPEGGAFN